MFKIVLLFLCVIVNVSSYNGCKKNSTLISGNNNDIIIWSEKRKLVWNDFKGTKPATASFSSIAGVSVKIRLDYKVKDIIQEFDVIAYMVKGESWSGDTSAYGLDHEQLHFDIGEVIARQLRKAIIENKSKISSYNKKKLDSIYFYYNDKLIETQKLYDEETFHSGIAKEQDVWNEKVKNQLDNLKQYARK